MNRGEMGRSFVTTGRMVMMRSIGYKGDERNKKEKKKKSLLSHISLLFVGEGAVLGLLISLPNQGWKINKRSTGC